MGEAFTVDCNPIEIPSFFIIIFIGFLPLLKYTVHVALPKNENIFFCWTFGSIVIIVGMLVLTYYTFKT